MNKVYSHLIVGVVCILLGIFIGYKLYNKPQKVVIDTKEIMLRDTSIVIQRVSDTVLHTKLVKVKDTKVISDVAITVVPDTTLRIDTVKYGDTLVITKTIGCDTVEIIMAILKDEKNGGIQVQAKSIGGTIVGAVTIPKSDLIFGKEFKNNLACYINNAPQDGTSIVGLMYDRGIGPFTIGCLVGTEMKNYGNINVGLQAGLRW